MGGFAVAGDRLAVDPATGKLVKALPNQPSAGTAGETLPAGEVVEATAGPFRLVRSPELDEALEDTARARELVDDLAGLAIRTADERLSELILGAVTGLATALTDHLAGLRRG